jgi:hypothetical protein
MAVKQKIKIINFFKPSPIMSTETNKKETFKDQTYYLAKGLYHIRIAKDYYEMLRVESSFAVKQMLSLYINKLQWLIDDIYVRLSEENRQEFKKELIKGDVIFFDAIGEMLIHLSQDKRAMVEDFVKALLNGEDVTVHKNIEEPHY